MCGLAGIWALDSQGAPLAEHGEAIRAMTALQRRRGPDDEGYWSSHEAGLHLGFSRLAVLDPSPAGHQPMISRSGRSVIVFNGEVYNFRELRGELESHGTRFRSGSDTEVVLEALERWGTDAIERFNGMFALAWFDLRDRELILARDHAGIKPLYYFVEPGGRGVAFASQFNALLHTPWGDPGPIRRDVVALYLRIHHIPAPYAMLEHTHQVQPGEFVRVRADGSVRPHRWWSLTAGGESGPGANEIWSDVRTAVDRQLVSDVPLGVFISGGIDSPLVGAAARDVASTPLPAFTLGVPGWDQDESHDAARYAAHLGLEHHLTAVSDVDIQSAVHAAVAAQYEPFADFSILPSLLLHEAARKRVTVALSGDGGDELFFGYQRPVSLLRDGHLFRFPRPLRVALYTLGKIGLGPRRSDVIVHPTPGHYYASVNTRLRPADVNRIAPALGPPPHDFAVYDQPSTGDLGALVEFSRRAEYGGQLQRCLKKVDMASMHHSLEVRVPLLDRAVVDASLRLQPIDDLRAGYRKRVLREALERRVPPGFVSSAKRGFGVPLGQWMREGLRDLTEATLFQSDRFDSLLDRDAIRRYWSEHLNGTRDLKWGLWTLFSLRAWAREHGSAT